MKMPEDIRSVGKGVTCGVLGVRGWDVGRRRSSTGLARSL